MKIKAVWIPFLLFGMISCQDSATKMNDEACLLPLYESNQSYRKSEVLHSDYGLPVLKEEFKERWQQLPETIRRMKDGEENRKRIMNRILEEKLLFRDGLDNGVYRKPEIRKSIREFARNQVLKERMEQLYKAVPDPSEAEMLSYYEKHTERFKRPAGANVDLVHFSRSEKVSEREILRKCRETLAELSRGRTINEVVEENGNTRTKSGINRFVKKGSLPVPVWRAVSRMKHTGELSSPLQTSDGCYIVRFIEKRPPGRTPFSEVKDEIRTLFLREKREKALVNHVENLKKKYRSAHGQKKTHEK